MEREHDHTPNHPGRSTQRMFTECGRAVDEQARQLSELEQAQEELAQHQHGVVDQLRRVRQELLERLAELTRGQQALAHQASENHQQQLRYQDELFIRPLQRRLGPLIGWIDDRLGQRHTHDESAETEALQCVRRDLVDTLAEFDIQLIEPATNDPVDPTCMKAVQVVYTRKPDMVGRVFLCLRAGMRRGDKVLKPAEIKVVQKESHPPQSSL